MNYISILPSMCTSFN